MKQPEPAMVDQGIIDRNHIYLFHLHLNYYEACFNGLISFYMFEYEKRNCIWKSINVGCFMIYTTVLTKL